MTELIKATSVFIRANTGSEEALKASDALANAIDGAISLTSAVSVISSLLGREFLVRDCVPNGATAFAVNAVRELRKALRADEPGTAYDIADILQALPEKVYLTDKRAVSDFNRTYIAPFNKKHGLKLPLIV